MNTLVSPPQRYCVHYVSTINGNDTPDPEQGTPFVWRCRAFNKQHAEQKFIDSCDGDTGWLVMKVERMKDL